MKNDRVPTSDLFSLSSRRKVFNKRDCEADHIVFKRANNVFRQEIIFRRQTPQLSCLATNDDVPNFSSDSECGDFTEPSERIQNIGARKLQ